MIASPLYKIEISATAEAGVSPAMSSLGVQKWLGCEGVTSAGMAASLVSATVELI